MSVTNPQSSHPSAAPGPWGTPPPPAMDGCSVASLVTALTIAPVFPVPITLGIIGLRRTKSGERAGRGLAIAGIAITAGLWGIIAVILLTVFLTQGQRDRNDLAQLCRVTDRASCDALYAAKNASSADRQLADTCAGQEPAGSGGICVAIGFVDAVVKTLPTIEPADGAASTPSHVSQLFARVIGPDVSSALANPTQRERLLSAAISRCDDGQLGYCDFVGFAAKPGETAALSAAETCGGRVPGGGQTLRCQDYRVPGQGS